MNKKNEGLVILVALLMTNIAFSKEASVLCTNLKKSVVNDNNAQKKSWRSEF